MTSQISAHPFLARLARGEAMTSLGVRSSRTPEISRFARAAGFDLLFVDREHSTISLDATVAICGTASDLGLVTMVRVGNGDFGDIGRLLDGGVQGIIFGHVENGRQAAQFSRLCRFEPRGCRSAIGTLPQINYQKLPSAEFFALANQKVLVNVMIESSAGVENVREIASAEGVDMVSVGVNDLCLSMGLPGEHGHPTIAQALDRIVHECTLAGTPVIVGGVPAQQLQGLIAQGAAPVMLAGADSEMLLGAMRERNAQAKLVLTPDGV